MGYNGRPDCVLQTLAALEVVLAAEGHHFSRGAGVDAAYAAYKDGGHGLPLASGPRRLCPLPLGV